MEEAINNEEAMTVTESGEIVKESEGTEHIVEAATSNDIGESSMTMEVEQETIPNDENNPVDNVPENNPNTTVPPDEVASEDPPASTETNVDTEPTANTEFPASTVFSVSVEPEVAESGEETSGQDLPQPSISKVLSASQIDEMFELTEPVAEESSENAEPNPSTEDQLLDISRVKEVNIQDMKVVQKELRELDILVCGSCHQVFHFIPEFQEHKGPGCRMKSDFHGNIVETKPQVWAFLLWKNSQAKDRKTGEESSWKLYQKWCKMPEGIRNAWIAAGGTVMNFSTFGGQSAHPNKLEPKDDSDTGDEHRPVIMKKFVHRDATGEIREIKSSASASLYQRRRLMNDVESLRNQLEDDNSQDRDMSQQHRQEDSIQEEEFVVEKIVSRRFNPRKKQYEYLLKWEGYPSEQNTWEPAENLEACQHLLKAFEENLRKQTLSKQQAGGGGGGGVVAGGGLKQRADHLHPSPQASLPVQQQSSQASPYSGGRPIRYSKQKALSQVKQWCGSIKPDDTELELLKRKNPLTDSDDEDDPFLKKIKLENRGAAASDSEDSMSTPSKSGIVRRPGRPPLKPKITNGTTESLAAVLGLDTLASGGEDLAKSSAIEAINRGIIKKSTGMSPHNQQVLVANAKGVVKVDPSQVPNLTSGVYIMSNKSGIIKLDSVSPSKALSLKGMQGGAATPTGPTKILGATPKQLGPVTTTPSQSGMIVVNRAENQGTGGGGPRSTEGGRPTPPTGGLVKRPVGRPPSRGVGRPPGRGGQTSYRASPNPNTRLIHSGTRPNFTVNPGPRPPLKTPINNIVRKQTVETPGGGVVERKILGPKPSPARGGGAGASVGRGGGRGGRTAAGGVVGSASSVLLGGKPKRENIYLDLPQDTSSDSEAGLPELFHTSGKVVQQQAQHQQRGAESHQSQSSNQTQHSSNEVGIKKDPEGEAAASFLGQLAAASASKEQQQQHLVKKTLKPGGSIGSMSVSPQKSFLPEEQEEEGEEEDEDEMVTITGDDGMIYKVRKSELTNSLLVGEDGQPCVYVTTGGVEPGSEEGTVLTLDPAGDVSELQQVNILEGESGEETAGGGFLVKEGGGEAGEGEEEAGGVVGTDQLVSLEVEGAEGQSQVVAQLVEASEPAPGGGPRKVVLLLPDGNLMMTEVDEEQYAALELDKYQATTAEMK